VHVDIRRAVGRKEIVAIANRLNEDEFQPERSRCHRNEHELRIAIGADARRRGEDRQHQREGRHRDQRRKAGVRSLNAKALLAVREPARYDARANHTVADDHHRGVDRVARQNENAGATGEQHRQNQRGLDDRNGHREYQCPERLADSMGNDLGMMDRRDDGTHQRHCA